MIVHLNSISAISLVVIGVVALLVFGPKKLPELGKALGTTLREFKQGTQGLIEDDDSKKNNVIEHKDKENK